MKQKRITRKEAERLLLNKDNKYFYLKYENIYEARYSIILLVNGNELIEKTLNFKTGIELKQKLKKVKPIENQYSNFTNYWQ